MVVGYLGLELPGGGLNVEGRCVRALQSVGQGVAGMRRPQRPAYVAACGCILGDAAGGRVVSKCRRRQGPAGARRRPDAVAFVIHRPHPYLVTRILAQSLDDGARVGYALRTIGPARVFRI